MKVYLVGRIYDDFESSGGFDVKRVFATRDAATAYASTLVANTDEPVYGSWDEVPSYAFDGVLISEISV